MIFNLMLSLFLLIGLSKNINTIPWTAFIYFNLPLPSDCPKFVIPQFPWEFLDHYSTPLPPPPQHPSIQIFHFFNKPLRVCKYTQLQLEAFSRRTLLSVPCGNCRGPLHAFGIIPIVSIPHAFGFPVQRTPLRIPKSCLWYGMDIFWNHPFSGNWTWFHLI